MIALQLPSIVSCSHRRSLLPCAQFLWVAIVLIAVAVPLPSASASALPVLPGSRAVDVVPGMSGAQIVAPRGFLAALAKAQRTSLSHASAMVPSFSRQTKLACSACHYAYPQLTPFGRQFKLNGYTLTGLSTIGEPMDTSGGLKLAPIPPVAAMVVASVTRTRSEERSVGTECRSRWSPYH